MDNKAKFWAFISYSHADARQARAIHHFLENYKIPKHLVGKQTSSGVVPRRLRPIFKDREELPSASDLSELVNQALEASRFLIVICSPNSATSKWVNEEVLNFKKLGRASRILCIIVDGEPNATDLPGRAAEECFCEALRFRIDDDLKLTHKRAEPVAADARRNRDGRRLARLKLVAGMLGIGLDELRQRDMQQRNRRMAVISTVLAMGMALTLVLAWAAFIARDDAERRRGQAENLISFMLGDLRQRLNEVGRLDVLDSVAIEAMNYFAELPAKEINDDVLSNRATALLQIGQAQLTRGLHKEAMNAFLESLNAYEELVARNPDNMKLLFDLGQAHFWVGYVHWESEDLDAADVSMQAYFKSSKQLYDNDPLNEQYILELGYSFNNLAILSNSRGDNQAALDYNRQMISLCEAVLERDKENQQSRLALADAYSWRGSMLQAGLKFRAAADQFTVYLAHAEEASLKNPANTQWLQHRMLASRFAGEATLNLGRSETATNHFAAGIALASELLKIEPANENWQIEHAVLAHRLAQAEIRNGGSESSLNSLEVIRVKTQERIDGNPDRIDWLVINTDVRLEQGRALLATNQLADAANHVDAVLESARELMDMNPNGRAGKYLLANSLILRARVANETQASPSKNNIWRETLDAIHRLSADSTQVDLLDAAIRASLYAGRTGTVDRQIEVLSKSGYRYPDFVAVLHEQGIDY